MPKHTPESTDKKPRLSALSRRSFVAGSTTAAGAALLKAALSRSQAFATQGGSNSTAADGASTAAHNAGTPAPGSTQGSSKEATPSSQTTALDSVKLTEQAKQRGGWSKDGSWATTLPSSAQGNASTDDGTARMHNGYMFPADDASPIAPVDIPETWDYETDFVVVGAGGGGLNAAARLAGFGADVICVEAMSFWGGNAMSAGMCGILGGSKMQDERKFALPKWPYDPQDMVDYALPQYQYSMDPDLLYLIAEQGGPALDWMADCGVEWRLGHVPVYVAPKASTLDHHVLKMKDATDAMYHYAVDHGCTFLFNTPASALVRNSGGRIVGVKCTTLAGDVYVGGAKAVILTAGGFCNNKALLQKYCPTASMACASSYMVGGETGVCTRMGLGAGADISGFNSSASFDGGVDWEAEGGTWAHFLYDGMTQLSRQPWLTIDRTGRRCRYMDSNVSKEGANAIYALGDLATIQMMRPGHRSYIIFDAHYQDYLGEFAQEHCRMFLTPGLEQEEKIPPRYRDWRNGVQDALDADVLKKRDTLEELERDLGLEEGVLTRAVEDWNATCAAGHDDFIYPMPDNWLFPVLDPPFYGCRIGGNLYGTKAGLLINTKMQVIGTNGRVIKGLYAGWHTAGGACGENSYVGQPILGSIMGDVGLAFCGGYLCGSKAYEEEVGEIPAAD